MYIFRLHNGTCGLLVTQPGIEPAPPALEGQSLKYWTTREVSSKKKYFWGDYRRQIAGNQRWCVYWSRGNKQCVAVQFLSCVQLFVTPWLQHARLPCPSPSPRACSNSYPISQWCYPTSLSSVVPFSFFLSCPAWVFSNESPLLNKWPKYWSFNFSISPSSEYSALISFRIDWLDLLAGQGTLKSLVQHHS